MLVAALARHDKEVDARLSAQEPPRRHPDLNKVRDMFDVVMTIL